MHAHWSGRGLLAGLGLRALQPLLPTGANLRVVQRFAFLLSGACLLYVFKAAADLIPVRPRSRHSPPCSTQDIDVASPPAGRGGPLRPRTGRPGPRRTLAAPPRSASGGSGSPPAASSTVHGPSYAARIAPAQRGAGVMPCTKREAHSSTHSPPVQASHGTRDARGAGRDC